ncbi:putative glycosyltransferase [Fundidesulfovibrio magnetotacticus]|uniref:Putative glycosyltransferase n=2 Tax=Fundidesulfovibrio magnetotacticus TaxID=2730080 RepID=A0A6V8LUP1_9BACT|nr:putative glycosyltransferase [Fundidesulfovibrio magnetotacticus]
MPMTPSSNRSPSADDRSLVVVVPLYNEESNVEAFFDRLARGVGPDVKGVVVVDDGSTDQTVTLVERYLHDYPAPVKLVRLSRNFGHQPAVVAGCHCAAAWARELGAAWVGVIDGDLQDRPEDFSLLLDHGAGQDVVYAVRAERYDGLVMRWCAPVFYRLLSMSASFHIPRNAGTFSIIRTEVAGLLVESADANPYFPGLRAAVGFRQKSIELDRQARASGSSKVALKGLVALSFRAFILHSDLPMRLILAAMGVLFVVLVFLGAGMLVLRFSGTPVPMGITTVVMLNIFSMGLSAAFFFILAAMVSRVKTNTSRQQPWVIMETRESLGRTPRDPAA